MREIKFRAWDKEYNKYLKYDEYAFQNVHDVFYNPEIDLDIEMYTGLKDKDGVEIYEGDIILYKNPNDTVFVLEVLYDCGSFEVRTAITKVYFDDLCGVCMGHAQVMGNIHENPELLEDK